MAVVKKDDESTTTSEAPRGVEPAGEALAVMEAASVSQAELGAWLRRKRLKANHPGPMEGSTSGASDAVFAPREPRASAEDRKRVKELESVS